MKTTMASRRSKATKDSRGKLLIQLIRIIVIKITDKEVAISSIIKRSNIEMIIKKAVIHNSNTKTNGLNTSQEATRLNREDSNKVGETTNIAKEEKVKIEAVMVRTNSTMKRRAISQEIIMMVSNHQGKIIDNIIMINKDNKRPLQKAVNTQIKNNRRNSMDKVS